MKVELPPFKNGDHNSEEASTLDRDLTIYATWKNTLAARLLLNSITALIDSMNNSDHYYDLQNVARGNSRGNYSDAILRSSERMPSFQMIDKLKG